MRGFRFILYQNHYGLLTLLSVHHMLPNNPKVVYLIVHSEAAEVDIAGMTNEQQEDYFKAQAEMPGNNLF